MNKETYLAKLATTVMTDANTLGEAAEAKKVKTALVHFWEKRALGYIKRTTGRDLMEEQAGWKVVRYIFSLKAEGKITVELWLCDDNRPAVLGERFIIKKKNLLK